MVESIDEITVVVRRLVEEGRMVGRRWTLAEMVEHIALTMEWTAGLRPDAGPPPRRLPRLIQALARRLVLVGRWIPPGLPMIPAVAPSAGVDLATALLHLKQAIGRLRETSDHWPSNPFFGTMTKEEWLRFHAIHAWHHLQYARRRFGGPPCSSR